MELEEIIRENAECYGIPIIRENSHKKLEEIVRQFQPKHILEIGTAVGYSAITMLNASNNSDIITIEHDHDKVVIANENLSKAGLDGRYDVKEADCLQCLASMLAEDEFVNHFDLCFIDGPKAQYQRIYDLICPMMKKGGIVLADNVLFRGYVKDNSLMPRRFKTIVKRLKEFLDFVANDNNISSFEIDEDDDGLLIIHLK